MYVTNIFIIRKLPGSDSVPHTACWYLHKFQLWVVLLNGNSVLITHFCALFSILYTLVPITCTVSLPSFVLLFLFLGPIRLSWLIILKVSKDTIYTFLRKFFCCGRKFKWSVWMVLSSNACLLRIKRDFVNSNTY